MPLRSVKMKRFIFGFQRLVWCPKWAPLSRSWRMLTTAMLVLCPVVMREPSGSRPGALARHLPRRDRDASPVVGARSHAAGRVLWTSVGGAGRGPQITPAAPRTAERRVTLPAGGVHGCTTGVGRI